MVEPVSVRDLFFSAAHVVVILFALGMYDFARRVRLIIQPYMQRTFFEVVALLIVVQQAAYLWLQITSGDRLDPWTELIQLLWLPISFFMTESLIRRHQELVRFCGLFGGKCNVCGRGMPIDSLKKAKETAPWNQPAESRPGESPDPGPVDQRGTGG